MTWAITSGLSDLSDLYREKMNPERSSYFIEGEGWKQLKVEKSPISVKGMKEPVEFEIKYTHRGPLVDADLL